MHVVASMFRGVTYNRFTTAVVREKMEAKIAALRAKVEERRGRVSKLMEEHKITPEMLSDMVIQYMKDQIVTEKNLIESESEEAKRMVLIVRNLRDTLPAVDEKTGAPIERAVIHTLTDDEIDYLGL